MTRSTWSGPSGWRTASGGHLVQGHVDAVGTCRRPRARTCASPCPAGLLRYVVEKGSITVDGVSLTVVEVLEDGFTVAVIPHTLGGHHAGRPPGRATRSTWRST